MPVGRDFERVPRDEHGARLLLAVEAQQAIRKAENGAGRLAAAPQDCLRQRVIGAVREGIAVDHQQRPAGERLLRRALVARLLLALASIVLEPAFRAWRGASRSTIHAGA